MLAYPHAIGSVLSDSGVRDLAVIKQYIVYLSRHAGREPGITRRSSFIRECDDIVFAARQLLDVPSITQLDSVSFRHCSSRYGNRQQNGYESSMCSHSIAN